jgi:hypothetical protein
MDEIDGTRPMFGWLVDVSLNRVFPTLGNPVAVELYKLVVSASSCCPRRSCSG